jgi:putative DNA methylase
MFSNHILKPERTPLENSVWGTSKSSGTFCTLFESRLLRAKRYLDKPFELAFEQGLFGDTGKSIKLVASSPIDVVHAASWQALEASPHGVLILNGDSARLPLPDSSVDAVITDPPYFDFVHYSELSDFFFAWLSPALKERYSWFDKPNSSDPAEVQHKDPLEFARHFGAVLAECHRVLKDEGVLAFSFHHSRAEGWAAISEALTMAGFDVVASHPVHGELRASNPKNAAKDPISLDAILVCRKHVKSRRAKFDPDSVPRNTEELCCILTSAGMSISSADRFVIAASQALVAASSEQLSFASVQRRLELLRCSLVPPQSLPSREATPVSALIEAVLVFD